MESVYDLLDELDRVREQFLVAIESLPDEALLQPGVIGTWSIADLMASIAVWEAELVTGLMQLDQGRKPTKLLQALANPDRFTAQRYEENKDRDLDRIFDDFQGVRVQLEGWVETFPEKALLNPKQFPALGGRSLAHLIGAASFKREQTYIAALKAFATRQEAEAAATPPVTLIPLTAVMPLEQEDDNDNQSD